MVSKEGLNLIIKKSLAVIVGVIIASLGISLFYALNIGTDPMSVLVDGEHNLMNVGYGTVTLINSVVLITFGLFFARKYLKIGTIIGGLLMGPLINIFVPLFSSLLGESTSFIIKVVLLFPAVALLGVGISLIISVNFGVGSIDLLVLTVRDATKIKLKWVKMAFDLLFTIAGYLMGGIIGVGTVVGVLFTGPIIDFTIPYWKKLLSKSLKLELESKLSKA